MQKEGPAWARRSLSCWPKCAFVDRELNGRWSKWSWSYYGSAAHPQKWNQQGFSSTEIRQNVLSGHGDHMASKCRVRLFPSHGVRSVRIKRSAVSVQSSVSDEVEILEGLRVDIREWAVHDRSSVAVSSPSGTSEMHPLSPCHISYSCSTVVLTMVFEDMSPRSQLQS